MIIKSYSREAAVKHGNEPFGAVLVKDGEIVFANERISWSMPTWWKGHNIIHFAAAKQHIGIYPGPAAVEYFAGELRKRGLKFSKGAIQIPYGDNLPLDLIAEISRWCGEHNCEG